VVSLALNGEPTHLRRLVERLQARMPGVPVLLGLWLAQNGQSERVARAQAGATNATGQVASLREAIEAVLAAVQADIAGAPEAGAAARAPEPAEA